MNCKQHLAARTLFCQKPEKGSANPPQTSQRFLLNLLSPMKKTSSEKSCSDCFFAGKSKESRSRGPSFEPTPEGVSMASPSCRAIPEWWNQEIPNSKHQTTHQFQVFTLWNPAFGRFARGEIPQNRYSMTKTENRFGPPEADS